MPSNLMGVYGHSAREMYWFGSSESAYEPGCDSSPGTPHFTRRSPPQTNPQDGSQSWHRPEPPLTPLSTSSTGSVQPNFISPNGGTYNVSDGESNIATMGSPCSATSCTEFATKSSRISQGSDGPSETNNSFCAGCSGHIYDRFYLQAVGQKWHEGCLRCSACQLPLDTAATCFVKDKNIFCRDDYHRLFYIKRCANCHIVINRSQLVLHAGEYIYHVQCFVCAHCNVHLRKGDQYAMNGSLIYCRDHYNQLERQISPVALNIPFSGGVPPSVAYTAIHNHHIREELPSNFTESMHKVQFFNGVTTQHKGRPRKRKPKDETMDTNIGLSNAYDLESYGNSCQQVRSKRIRTSFKHNQLRIMKSYFNMNHNPDAKDLRQLATKTGLSKRVLQVWFQNARAKFRRQSTKDLTGVSNGDATGSAGDLACSGGDISNDFTSTPPGSAPPMSPEDSQGLSYQQIF